MSVQRATLSDAVALAALHNACLAFQWSVQDMQWLLRDPAAIVLCVRDATSPSRLLGYLAAKPVGESLELMNLAVLPAARRQGIASALIEALKRTAVERTITLEVRETNRAAIELYTQHGFRVLHRRAGYYADTGEAGLLMRYKNRQNNDKPPENRALTRKLVELTSIFTGGYTLNDEP